jgi:O-acetyl-ADP-ribose deacetylase (regulator of RNase III)
MKWSLKHGGLLDEPADVLVCSGNVFLNLSGGVGGAFLLHYGGAMQEELHRYLASRQIHFVQPGEAVRMPPCGSPYRAVLHAVAVDAFYQSSPALVRDAIRRSLTVAADTGASKVALAALATGYGRLSMSEFAKALLPLIGEEFPPIEEAALCLRSAADVEELTELVPGLSCARSEEAD